MSLDCPYIGLKRLLIGGQLQSPTQATVGTYTQLLLFASLFQNPCIIIVILFYLSGNAIIC